MALSFSSPGTHIYSDAAWKLPRSQPNAAEPKAGLGVYIEHYSSSGRLNVQISAASPPCSSPLQAEAWALLLAVISSRHLQLETSTFLTDNLTLAQAAEARSILKNPGHWSLRPLLDEMHSKLLPSSSIRHVPRDCNGVAHNLASNARKSGFNSSSTFACVN